MQVSLKTTAKKHKATLNGEIGFVEQRRSTKPPSKSHGTRRRPRSTGAT
jgi:hypothetical protein